MNFLSEFFFGRAARIVSAGVLCTGLLSHPEGVASEEVSSDRGLLTFGRPGKIKMLYDARQRPQSVMIGKRIFIVYNGDARPSGNGRGHGHPMLTIYDCLTRSFTDPVRLGPSSTDHHDGPIIWADGDDRLHVLYGCHRTPGTHLISKRPIGEEAEPIDWEVAPQIAPKLSYPTVFRVQGGRELIYYRTDGHTSSWTYRLSADKGRTWQGPERDITDLDSKGRLDWSSYQTKTLSPDGRFLHVIYTDYDDNKHDPDPERFYNPRYDGLVSNEWKYNLSYVKIDLNSHRVFNAEGEALRTPIDIDYSKMKCQIWDTNWRGAGIPPAVALDGKGEPALLHVLSEKDLKTHRYYYVRREGGQWIRTPICDSNHQWNSGYLSRDPQGGLHAFVIVGEGYLEGGYMDGHGGGVIEEWISLDQGHTWDRHRQLSPASKRYAGWRFNNVQPVVRADGTTVENMLLFYGWYDAEAPQAEAFLWHL